MKVTLNLLLNRKPALMAAALQDTSEITQDFQDKFKQGDDSEDDGTSLALQHESTRENVSTDGNNLRADSPLFAQNVRDKDRLAIFRASNRELKMQKKASLKASLKAAVETNAQKEAELEDIKRRGLDGNSNHVYAQLKREKTEIAMHVSDHKSERLKRTGKKMMTGNKADSFYNSVQLASQMSKLPLLQRACWEVTNFVPLKIHGATQSAAAQASQVREVTEDPAVLKANEMAQVVFEPTQPMIVESFKSCEGLSRIAFLDGNTAVMLGKIVTVNFK